MARKLRIEPYKGPAGGWGSMKSVTRHMTKQKLLPDAIPQLMAQNKPEGFMCVSCAWAKPRPTHAAEFCENGAKATFAEITRRRTTPEFFAAHAVTELRSWSDHDLEHEGRITHPMRFNHQRDRYEPVTWEDAIADIGRALREIGERDPRRAVFYTSGRASLEASYMYQLFARMFGNNNLPDSSNMCHESTSVALPEAIGVPVGTVRLEDFDEVDLILFFGQNVGSNSPRMLHQLKDAVERGTTIISFNPLRERGLERFVDPQNPVQMLSTGETQISSLYYQVKAGGDIAAITGICKALFELDRDSREQAGTSVFDMDFLASHTHGFTDFETFIANQGWPDLERESGLMRADMEMAARTYANAGKVIGIYGMGLTQHKLGVETVQMLVNLLLLRGNIGRSGTGICPVRGHSNVQGQRTVGIAEKPELVPLDRLAGLFHFEPPREKGYDTVEACEAIVKGEVDAFIGLGGNFLRSVPDRGPMEEHWPRMRLTVQIATKLNRSHLFNGETAYLLPCLGRIEVDRQASGEQMVSMEDSTGVFHSSYGKREPASEHLRSEPWIVANIAKATLGERSGGPDWDGWVGNYDLIRDAIAKTWPDTFADFNARIREKGGFGKPIAARERKWNTETGKANFISPSSLNASFDAGDDGDVLRLITLRSNDQFNTTVYGYRDRFRGIYGSRMVVLLNKSDMERFGLKEGEEIALVAEADDRLSRRLEGLSVVPYDIPRGCAGAYYPEANVLIPLYQKADRSHVPAAKSVPVRIAPMHQGNFS